MIEMCLAKNKALELDIFYQNHLNKFINISYENISCVFCVYTYGVLCQVWCLIQSIPDGHLFLNLKFIRDN